MAKFVPERMIDPLPCTMFQRAAVPQSTLVIWVPFSRTFEDGARHLPSRADSMSMELELSCRAIGLALPRIASEETIMEASIVGEFLSGSEEVVGLSIIQTHELTF